MTPVELVLILIATIALLAVVAMRTELPLPVLLVAAGLAVALIPGIPHPELDPQAIFIVFVPPLLYIAPFESSPREMKRFFSAIFCLAVALVLATAAAVAAVAHALVPELTWPAAFVLGAIVSPPDAVAAIAMLRRLRIPRTIVTVLEGESLTNDATALVTYQMAVAAAATGSFSLGDATARFFAAALGGVAIGALVGVAIVHLRSRVGRTPTVEATVSLLTPFIAYIPADRLGTSGVLAVVAAGLYVSRWARSRASAQSRLQVKYMWRMVTFLLEGLTFLLVGLRLPAAFDGLGDHGLLALLLYATLVTGAAIAVRVVGLFPLARVAWWLRAARDRGAPPPPWRWVLFGGLAGIRGGDSLVIALAVPLALPGRPMIVFLSFVVIIVTLAVIGPLLPLIARRLGLDRALADETFEDEAHARARLLAEVPAATLTQEGVAALRGALVRLWEAETIGDGALEKLQHELDLAEAMLDARPSSAAVLLAVEVEVVALTDGSRGSSHHRHDRPCGPPLFIE